ncbi:MAG: DUF4153 domain-containing protein, partial [Clostridia bacterium]|nr:DUF4153 domain-containing protein [Clostridia bacterium]
AMVTSHESSLAKFYRRVYPIASIVILIFEAWALVIQLQASGLKLTEYIFILIWVLAAAGDVLLLVRKSGSHHLIAILACSLAVISVLPVVGYNILPVKFQIVRLEKLLVEEGIMVGSELMPAASEPDKDVRAAITDAVEYLAYADDAKLPAWFVADLNNNSVFEATLGFEKTWIYDEQYTGEPTRYLGTYLYLTPSSVDISDYRWAVSPYNNEKYNEGYASVDGDNGFYQIYWNVSNEGIPSIEILMDGNLILEQDMDAYIDGICEKYPPGQSRSTEAGLEDLSLSIETPEINVLLVFSDIGVSVDTVNDTFSCWVNLKSMYLSENP